MDEVAPVREPVEALWGELDLVPDLPDVRDVLGEPVGAPVRLAGARDEAGDGEDLDLRVAEPAECLDIAVGEGGVGLLDQVERGVPHREDPRPLRVKKRNDLVNRPFGLVVEDEVPGAVDRDERRRRDLALEAVGAAERRELIVGAPEEQRRDAELAELALLGLELLEVHRAIELERRALPAALVERGPVGVDVLLAEVVAVGAEQRREAVAVERGDDLLALLGADRLGHPVPLAVGEEAGVADHERRDPVGVLAGPGEADEPAPVVDDERDRARGRARRCSAVNASRLRSKVAGRSRRSRRASRGRARSSGGPRSASAAISGSHISELSGKPWTRTTGGPVGRPPGRLAVGRRVRRA